MIKEIFFFFRQSLMIEIYLIYLVDITFLYSLNNISEYQLCIIKFFLLLLLFWVTPSISSDVVFASKELSSIYIEPRADSPMIYPIEIGKELIVTIESRLAQCS